MNNTGYEEVKKAVVRKLFVTYEFSSESLDMAFFTVMHLAALCLAALVYRISRIGKREPNLPPGPPTIPILGNLHIFPREKTYLQCVFQLSVP